MEQLNKFWRKSSYSGNNGGSGSCVELGQIPGTVLVRDTTNREGFTLPVSPAKWQQFTGCLKDGGLSL